MAEKTHIQWTDATINFWTGCKKISEGCKYCYMYRDKERYGQEPTEVMKVSLNTINKTLKSLEQPSKIFTCSWSDFFIGEADEWRDEAWEIIRNNPQHQWQILTKRPERIMDNLPPDWGDGWENVWLGVTIENQETISRAAILAKVPAKTRFISAEPLLEEVNFLEKVEGRLIFDDFHWIILGGESGNETGKYLYRPCEIEWLTKIMDDLRKHAPHVAIFNKQLGTYLAKKMGLKDRHGGGWDEWPEKLRIREFPNQVSMELPVYTQQPN